MGAGKSKKEAKHAAAKALIEKLSDLSLYANAQQQSAALKCVNASAGQNVTTSTSATDDSYNASAQSSAYDDQVSGNPIGWLQEQCMVRRWPPPTYETEMEVGLPHERQFTIACIVLKFYEVGQGKSKKIAKRQAAHKMWLLLQQHPVDGGEAGSGELGIEEEVRV